jgi:hypothetical protein
MMEAVRTSETSVDNYFTRQYIPEDNSEQIKETCINDTTVRRDCIQIELYSGWNKSTSGFSQDRLIYLKVNLGLELDRAENTKI